MARLITVILTGLFILSAASHLGIDDSIDDNSGNKQRILSRKKRYLTFPEGSVIQLAYCLTVPTIIPQTIFNLGWTLGANYELPNNTRPFFRPGELSKRRDRRHVYGKIEAFLKAMGMDGHSCILRALCEAGQRIGPKGGFMEEILHTLFKFPSSQEFGYEEHLKYDIAHRTSRKCHEMFSGCSSSLIDMVFE